MMVLNNKSNVIQYNVNQNGTCLFVNLIENILHYFLWLHQMFGVYTGKNMRQERKKETQNGVAMQKYRKNKYK